MMRTKTMRLIGICQLCCCPYVLMGLGIVDRWTDSREDGWPMGFENGSIVYVRLSLISLQFNSQCRQSWKSSVYGHKKRKMKHPWSPLILFEKGLVVECAGSGTTVWVRPVQQEG
jgi:hypothetical protein